MSTSITPFLWFDGRAAQAAAFYTSVFHPEVSSPSDAEAWTDGPFMGTVSLPGLDLMLFDGGPDHAFSDAVSLFVSVETQEEVDRLWDALSSGGSPGRCGWLVDQFGVSWQIVPTALGRLLGSGDPERSMAVHGAMMTMGKLEIAALQAAFDGEG